MRERRTYGSVRGLRREPLVYSTIRQLLKLHEKSRKEQWEHFSEKGDFKRVFIDTAIQIMEEVNSISTFHYAQIG